MDNAPKLRNLSKTRWIARSESIQAVWVSFDVILTTLSEMSKSRNFDANSSTQAVNLAWKIQSVDFVISVMFMKNFMHRMHQMTEPLQAEELNIIDAMTVIESTVELLKRIKDDEDTMNKEMDAGIEFLQKLGVADPMEEYRRKHRMRRVHVRLDENQATGVSMSFHQYYRSEGFLNVLIVQYGENLTRCFETLKPLMVVLKPPLTEPSIDDIIDLVRFSPSNLTIDPHILHAEFSNFVSHVNLVNKNIQYPRRRSKLYRRAENGFPSYKSMLPFIDDNTSNCGEGRAYIQSAENRESTIANHYG